MAWFCLIIGILIGSAVGLEMSRRAYRETAKMMHDTVVLMDDKMTLIRDICIASRPTQQETDDGNA